MISVLVGKGWVSMVPLLGEGGFVAVCVGFVREVGGRGVVCVCVATLSSGAWCLVAAVMMWVWVCPYCLCMC